MVSIVVPVYNAEKRLSVCLESILKQTYSNFELILVNDGSKDKSLSLCKKYEQQDKRIKVIDKKNEGAGEARNAGVDIAQGEYVVFVDSDDTLFSDTLKTFIELINKESEVDMVCAAHVIEDSENGNKEYAFMEFKETTCIYSNPAEALLKMDKDNIFCYLWNKIFKMSIIKENNIRFEKQFITGQDLDFVIKYYYHVRKCVLTNEVVYGYYKDGVGSLSGRYKDNLYEIVSELCKRREDLYNYLKLNEDKEGRQILEKRYVEYFHSCIPNAYRKNAEIGYKKKKEIIKKIISDKKLQSYMKNYIPKNKIKKIYKFAIQCKSVVLTMAVYSILFCVRNNFNSIYQKITRGN